MFRKWILPAIALGLLGFAVLHVLHAEQAPPAAAPPIEPARSPYSATVAGCGLVEAQTENIAVGTPLAGVVREVQVQAGQKVQAGDPLFRLDDRHLQAERKVRQAALAAARAQLSRLDNLPRTEELPVSAAKVREAQAHLAEHEDQFQRTRALHTQNASSAEDFRRREQARHATRAQLARVQAEDDLLRAGAWKADKDVARAAVLQAQAQLDQVETEIERSSIRAPLEGEVLQVNVHPGEFVGAPPGQPLIVLGNVRRLHVRVDIDENDIPRFRPELPARAVVRGAPRQQLALNFVRVHPYVIPKKSLTGDNTERVDTRVLQVIYSLEPGARPIYVGQQLDVFILTDWTDPG